MPQKDDVESLLGEGMPFAELQIAEHGSFHPFAVVMKHGGAIEHVAAWTGDDQPEADELVADINAGLRSVVNEDRLIATAVFRHISLTDRRTQSQADAIAADLEHREGYSATVAFPYELGADGSLSINEPVAMPLASVVFAAPSSKARPALRPVPGALVATAGGQVIYNVLTPHMQQFLGRCIGALKKAGLIAKGTGQFSILVGEQQVELALSEFYQPAEDTACVQKVVDVARRLASGARS